MSLPRAAFRGLVILTLLVSLTSVVQTTHRVHGAGILWIDPAYIDPVPSGTQIKVNVRVDNMDQFNNWHINIQTNTNSLNGTSLDHNTESVFPQSVVNTYVDCINGGIAGANTRCQPTEDRLGIIHVEGTVSGPPPASPHSGILFSIIFQAGSVNFTNLHFVTHSINYACTPSPGCPIDLNPDAPDSMYGTPPVPDFSITLKDQSLSVIQGSSTNTSLRVSSIHSFSGRVNFTSTTDATGLSVTFTPNNVTLNNSTATAKVMISSATSIANRAYVVNVTGSSSGIVHYALLYLNVQPPGDFVLGFSPQQLALPEASSGSTTVLLTSSTRAKVSQEFSGVLILSLKAPRNTWTNAPVNATLDQTLLYVGPGATNSTTLSISIPQSPYAYTGLFAYQINVTAVLSTNHNVNQTQTMRVVPPPFDLSPSVTPSFLTITPGHSAVAKLSVTSVNYFVGSAYFSSTLSGGTARYNKTAIILGVGQTLSVELNVTIDSRTTPGNFVVLLTVYSGTGIARSVGESIEVRSSVHNAPLPIKILGLSPAVYFGILGGFGIIFVTLSALVYRKARLDRDEDWELR